MDSDQLRTFISVAELLSFSAAAKELALSQPTVSQRIRRLEDEVGRTLLDRDTHGVRVTADGETLLRYARQIVRTTDEALARFTTPQPSGRIRIGSADDLAHNQIADILRGFRRTNPHVSIEITVGQSPALARQLRAGRLDLAYVRHDPDMPDGSLIRCEQLVWAAHRSFVWDPQSPLPLVTYQPGSPTRAAAINALETAGIAWTVACAARDINGILAAVRAGIGVATFPLSMLPQGLTVLNVSHPLPPLGTVDFVVLTESAARPSEPVEALIEEIRRHSLQ